MRGEGAHPKVALVEFGEEFAAQPGEGRAASAQQEGGGDKHHERRFHRKGQSWTVETQEPADDPGFAGGDAVLQRQAGQDGHDQNGEDGSGDQGESQCQGHRFEDAAFDALEGVERDKGGQEDQLGENDGAAHLRGGLDNGGREGAHPSFALFQNAQEVFHHHDGGIDDDAEVNGAHGNQIGRNAAQVQEHERAQQSDRHRQCHDERGAVVAQAQEQDQHQQHQRNPFNHVCAHGVKGAVGQPDAVIIHLQADTRRQIALVDFIRHLLDAPAHLHRVFAAPHDHDPFGHVILVAGDLPVAALRASDAAQAHGVADDDAAHVADVNGRAVAGIDGDPFDVRDVPDQSETAHDVKL